ncbi:MAG: OmpA family protein [Elusimicrobiota bacterium]|jgi:outer membrane protein OmpA-like peptidoglycan-associated protein
MKRTLLPAFALILALPLAALAKPIVQFTDREEKVSDKEVLAAQEELDEIQRKISKKEIPPIAFELDSATLKESSKRTLDMVADLMLKHPYLKLMVFGHTCDLGGPEYNKKLSKKRADAVKEYLIEVGVMGEYIKAKGYGLEKPVVPNDSEENRSQNRRVELYVTNRWWQSVY